MTKYLDYNAGHECFLCGHPFGAHRMRDAQFDRIAAGEPVEQVAADYDQTVQEMALFWIELEGKINDFLDNRTSPPTLTAEDHRQIAEDLRSARGD